MTLQLPYVITDDETYSPTKIQACLDALAAVVPVQDANQGSMSAAKLTWPSGTIVPSGALPSTVAGGSLAGGASIADLTSDPRFSRAYETPFIKRVPASNWGSAPSGGGFVAPMREGVLVCGRTSNVVKEITKNRSGGSEGVWGLISTHSFASSDKPVDAACKDGLYAYVLCEGNAGAPNPSVKTISLGVGGGSATTWLDLGATYVSARNIRINKDGTYLYVTAKKSGDNAFRRVLRIDTATKVISECDVSGASASGNDIIGIEVIYTKAGTNSLGEVMVAYHATTAAVDVIAEATGNAYGGTFASTSTALAPSLGTFPARAACAYRGMFAVITYDSGTTSLNLNLIKRETTDAGSRTDVVARINLANIRDNDTNRAANNAVLGSAATDGRMIYCLTRDGGLAAWDPLTGSAYGWADIATESSATYYSVGSAKANDYCGLAFSGHHMIGFFHTTSGGAGYYLAF